jgi:hypothetical protein
VERQGQEAFRELSKDDKRVVWRALRRGDAVTDPRLVGATLEWTRTRPGRGIWGVLFQTVFFGTLLARTVLAMLAGNWRLVALNLVVFDFFALLTGVAVLLARRAKETQRATLLRQGW